jgi:hypothetical protein
MGVGVNGLADELREVANGILQRLDRIAERVVERETRDQLVYLTGNDITDANASASVSFTPPPGVIWFVESIVIASSAAGAVVRCFIDEINDPRLVAKFLGDAQGNVSPIPADRIIYVPQGRTLIVSMTGSPAGTTNVVNLRVRELITGE